MIDAPDGASKSKLTVPRINPADSVVGEWVIVDMVREVGREGGGGKEVSKQGSILRDKERKGNAESYITIYVAKNLKHLSYFFTLICCTVYLSITCANWTAW